MQGGPEHIPSRPDERIDVAVEFPSIRALVSVCGATSNAGKTTTAENVIRALKAAGLPATALKVTRTHLGDACPRGVTTCGTCASLDQPFRLVTETLALAVPGKDTHRYMTAGADAVLWLLVHPSAMAAGIRAALGAVAAGHVVVAEGNSFRDFASADLTLLAWSRRFPPKSSSRVILDRVDGCVERPDTASFGNGTEHPSPNPRVPQVNPDDIGSFVITHLGPRVVHRP